ncbi:hypothetical protein AMECASPLE_030749 [Ameca splendens]|uniref:Uncharacterized protein n=1 Tax=Ameca splendens TaxID=208324 RepID=A0ABV0XJ57_9TELE
MKRLTKTFLKLWDSSKHNDSHYPQMESTWQSSQERQAMVAQPARILEGVRTQMKTGRQEQFGDLKNLINKWRKPTGRHKVDEAWSTSNENWHEYGMKWSRTWTGLLW